MRTMLPLIALAAALSSGRAHATADTGVATDPVYVPGSQYTAVYNQSNGTWRLLPADGQDLVIATEDCATGAVFPKGLWLLGSDTRGRPELRAVSATPLPAGVPDRIPVRACDVAGDRTLAVPQTLIDLLTSSTGMVYLND